MSKMNNKQIWNFAREFAKKLYEINEYWFDEERIMTRDKTIEMYSLSWLADAEFEEDEYRCEGGIDFRDGIYESEGELEELVPRVTEDEEIEAVFFCEGDLWETLYYCEGYGRGDETEKAIYKAFVETVHKHGMWYEWGSGTIFLYGLS